MRKMGKLEVIDGKTTNWNGLWWHPENQYFSSAGINLSELRKFKGVVRLIVKKNKYYNNGENGRPNYHFVLRDAQCDNPINVEVDDIECEDQSPYYDDESGCYFNENDERLYTHEEVQYALNRCACDVGGDGCYGEYLVRDYL